MGIKNKFYKLPRTIAAVLLKSSKKKKIKILNNSKKERLKDKKRPVSLIIDFSVFFYVFNFFNLSTFFKPRRIISVSRIIRNFFYFVRQLNLTVAAFIDFDILNNFLFKRIRSLFNFAKLDSEKGFISYFLKKRIYLAYDNKIFIKRTYSELNY